MKLLKTLTHPEYPTPDIETVTREAARVVLMDKDEMVPLIYSSKLDVYKIPGWGIDAWEDVITAAKREAMEEVWCEIEILWEIWEIIEERPAHGYSKRVNLIQKSYCYYGKVISKSEVNMSESEISRGFELIWIELDQVLEKMKASNATTFKAKLVARRDMFIFEEYLKTQKEA